MTASLCMVVSSDHRCLSTQRESRRRMFDHHNFFNRWSAIQRTTFTLRIASKRDTCARDRFTGTTRISYAWAQFITSGGVSVTVLPPAGSLEPVEAVKLLLADLTSSSTRCRRLLECTYVV